MEKKLVRVGNGLALFIDRSLQRLLGIDANTLVDVTTDGVRLTVEPCGVNERPKKKGVDAWDRPDFIRLSYGTTSEERRLEYSAPGVFDELIERGVEDNYMLRLHHRYFPVELYRSLFYTPRPHTTDEHDRDDFKRFERCLQELRAGASWDAAISAALEAVPVRHFAPSRFYRTTGPDAIAPEVRGNASEPVRCNHDC